MHVYIHTYNIYTLGVPSFSGPQIAQSCIDMRSVHLSFETVHHCRINESCTIAASRSLNVFSRRLQRVRLAYSSCLQNAPVALASNGVESSAREMPF